MKNNFVLGVPLHQKSTEMYLDYSKALQQYNTKVETKLGRCRKINFFINNGSSCETGLSYIFEENLKTHINPCFFETICRLFARAALHKNEQGNKLGK